MIPDLDFTYEGCSVRFTFNAYTGDYWFKCYLDDEEIFDSGKHGSC